MARGVPTTDSTGAAQTEKPATKEKPVKDKSAAKEKLAIKDNASTPLTEDQKKSLVADAGITAESISPMYKLQFKAGFSPRTIKGRAYKKGDILVIEDISVIPMAFRDAWDILETPEETIQNAPSIVPFDGGYFVIVEGRILNDLPLTEVEAQEMLDALENS